jgi:hypothetical protein
MCLAQAELSPLHYRHGSIIVRGGKVIGQGFNTYRPSFDGGALKTGILSASALDGPGIKELKERLKSKSKSKFKPDEGKQQNQQVTGAFMPFESMGSGHNANTPLSMHSEMMAIRSALSLSSGAQSSQTSARAAAYYQKPCFRLPRDSKKRKARLQGLKAYAEAVCAEAASSNTTTGKVSGGKYSVQKQGFEGGASQPGQQLQRDLRQGGGCAGAQRFVEREEEYYETPEGKEEERVSVWVSVQRAVSRGFQTRLST